MMEYKYDAKNFLMFHVVSPFFLFFAILSLFLFQNGLAYFFSIISLSIVLNMVTFLTTYNEIKTFKDKVYIKKGLIYQKETKIVSKDIIDIMITGSVLSGMKPLSEIVLTIKLKNKKNSRFIIKKGFISDTDFSNLGETIKTLISKNYDGVNLN